MIAAFVIDSDERIAELYVAPDSDIDKLKIEMIRIALDIRYYGVSNENAKSLLGKHKWDVMIGLNSLKFILMAI